MILLPVLGLALFLFGLCIQYWLEQQVHRHTFPENDSVQRPPSSVQSYTIPPSPVIVNHIHSMTEDEVIAKLKQHHNFMMSQYNAGLHDYKAHRKYRTDGAFNDYVYAFNFDSLAARDLYRQILYVDYLIKTIRWNQNNDIEYADLVIKAREYLANPYYDI